MSMLEAGALGVVEAEIFEVAGVDMGVAFSIPWFERVEVGQFLAKHSMIHKCLLTNYIIF